MDNLKACPFCGSTHIQPAPLSDYEWYRCGDCDALSGRGGADGWNTRPLEDAANARAEKAEARAERYEEAIQQIDNWAKAYPLDVFPEPDFKRVREVLEAAGVTLDSVSASNMRHVITGVARITENALKGGEE